MPLRRRFRHARSGSSREIPSHDSRDTTLCRDRQRCARWDEIRSWCAAHVREPAAHVRCGWMSPIRRAGTTFFSSSMPGRTTSPTSATAQRARPRSTDGTNFPRSPRAPDPRMTSARKATAARWDARRCRSARCRIGCAAPHRRSAGSLARGRTIRTMRTSWPAWRTTSGPAPLETVSQAAVSRCGSFQPGRGKWQV
jgi:hypothetical protein